MTRMLNAYTREVDDTELAVAELMRQLDLDGRQLANSAGLLTCSFDFIESGMAAAVCKAMPFDVVGCTSLTTAMDGEADTMQLCLSVLTSDECRFAAACTAPLDAELAQPIEAAYRQALGTQGETPAMIFAFLPLLRDKGGELLLDALNTACGGVPVFGTIGCDPDTSEYANTFTLCNGVASRESLAMLLVFGDISPRFFVTSSPEDKVQKQKAIITASEGSVLKEVNNMPARDYLQTIGLFKGDGVEAMSAVPFVVNYNDGTQPVARAIYMLTDEGWAVCGGAMPTGATLSIGSIDYDDVLLTARQTLMAALDSGGRTALFLFPCLGRSLVLGADLFAETDVVKECVNGIVPYQLAYSGGEVCPVYNAEGKPVNRFHNFTFIACLW